MKLIILVPQHCLSFYLVLNEIFRAEVCDFLHGLYKQGITAIGLSVLKKRFQKAFTINGQGR